MLIAKGESALLAEPEDAMEQKAHLLVSSLLEAAGCLGRPEMSGPELGPQLSLCATEGLVHPTVT